MSEPKEVVDRAKGGKAAPSSKLLGTDVMSSWILLMRPVEDYLIEHNVHPNVLTVSSLIVSALAGLLFHVGWIFWAGVVLVAGSNFDMLDGRVARAQGITTKHGAFFDSCIDRAAEVLVLLGVMSYFRDGVFAYLVFLLMGSALMVSYTKARAEGIGVSCDMGIMQRPERIVYLGVASIFNFFGNLISGSLGYGGGDILLKLSVVVVLVLSVWTAGQRMAHVMGVLKESEAPPGETEEQNRGGS